VPGDTAVDQLLAAQDWNSLTKRLTFFAHHRLNRRSIETAREIAQQALTRIWDPDYKDWDPSREDLFSHLRSVVNGLVSNFWKSARERSEGLTAPDELARRATVDGRVVDGKLDAEAFLYELLGRVEGDPIVTELIYLLSDGVDKPAEQALHLKCDRNDIYNANRRLSSHVAALQATFDSESKYGR
jgi:hypothetical protein